MAKIGRLNTLMAIEETDIGLMLDGGPHGLILCPRKFLPEDAEPGEEFEVFVYLDSEDRLIATTETPAAQAGEFVSLEVTSVHSKMGAFLDWGLPKDLLLPFAEQLGRVSTGDRVVVYIKVDRRSNRLIATQRCHSQVDRLRRDDYDNGHPVSLLIADETPMGYNAIVNNRHLGLLYHSEVHTPIAIGDRIEGFVKRVRPEGKLDLTLDASGYQRVSGLSQDVIEALRHADGFLPMGDKSSPDEIRSKFGVSKRAFKQALGALYRKRLITLEADGIRLIK